jgi:restriction system protein
MKRTKMEFAFYLVIFIASVISLPISIRYRKNLKAKGIEIINSHARTLAIKYQQLVYTDEYGKIIDYAFIKEANRFCNHVLYVDGGRTMSNVIKINDALELINKAIQPYLNESNNEFEDNMDGRAFEVFIENEMKSRGWIVNRTPATGDQGIDLICSRKGLKIGLQCKCYSNAVGNKAVQEAIAGLKYYGLNRAAVISNAKFTEAAKRLSNAAGIILLHHSELDKL